MLNIVNNITIYKTGPSTGEASVKLCLGDEDTTLFVNKILIDLNDGSNPVLILKQSGTPIVSGTFIDQIKEVILDMFQVGLADEELGLFKYQDGFLKKQ